MHRSALPAQPLLGQFPLQFDQTGLGGGRRVQHAQPGAEHWAVRDDAALMRQLGAPDVSG